MVIVAEGYRQFVAAVGSESFRFATKRVNDINVHTTLAVRCESDVFPVGAPYWHIVMSRIGSHLVSLSAISVNGEDVAFVGEGYSLSVG